jgi:hypothetical protein
MAIYKILNAAFQVICYQCAPCGADAIMAAKAEGFSAQYCEFVKMASYDDSDEQYTAA